MITFVIASLVSVGWNYVSEGVAECNWGTAFQFAMLFGIMCPMIDMMRSNRGS